MKYRMLISTCFVFLFFQTNTTYADATKVPMTLKWNLLEGVNQYAVTVSRYDDFRESRSFKVNKSILHVMVIPGAHYYWRIEAFDKNEKVINQKKVYEFDVAKGGTASAEIVVAQEESPQLADRDQTEVPTRDNVSIANAPLVDDSPFGAELRISTEIGLLNFEQIHSAFGNVDVTGLLFPALGLSLKTPSFADLFFGQFYFQQIIGDFGSDSSGVTLQDSDFQWVRYGTKLHVQAYSDDVWGINPYLGFETIKTPYFYLSSPTVMTIREVDYSNALLGLRVNYLVSDIWSYYADIQYGFLLSDDGENLSGIDTSSSEFIDLDLGIIYSVPSGFFLGSALKLNQRQIDETLTDSTGSSQGSRDSLYYGLEVFAGIGF